VQAIELANDGRADLNAVIQQRLADEYIRGIGEVPSSWPAEALKAQAVAARSYALATVISANVATSAVPLTGYPKKVRAGCLCQVYATTADQNYVGYGKETAASGGAWVAAVAGTAPASDGQIVMSGSTVVKTFFSSSTGGLTQAVNEVWGSSAPWLTTVDDHWSLNAPNPNAAWSRTLSQASLVTAVNAALAKSYTTATSNGLTCSKLQVADIAVVSITDRYASRAVRELTFADSAGNTTTMIVAPGSGCDRVGPDRLRSMLGVKSTYLASASASTATVDPTGAVVKPLRKVSVSKWPSTLVNPSEYTFSGVLSPKQYGATVRLREKVGGSWVTVATTTTTITGRYRITWSAPAIGKHRLRITASNSKGSKSSAAKVVTVVGRVTFTAPSTAPHGTPVTLNGAVAPALPGVTLIIERRRWGTWRRIAVTTTNVDGTWRYELSTGTVPTSLKLRVRTIDPGIGRVSSRIRTIAIT
jgi:SpoIID/LytB domain protein